ncbi:hypothetical protein Pcinc_019974 [Petrolisthes cinctipes]|uniref:Uncharacterized protein n=1 Tax=Petrolisthes cinctipes TaxID=88211 RepID=A0AAE1FNP0_PETCI|nr:hypothetical protein Pcinc_019974 [Petrolisthes cinctipes]
MSWRLVSALVVVIVAAGGGRGGGGVLGNDYNYEGVPSDPIFFDASEIAKEVSRAVEVQLERLKGQLEQQVREVKTEVDAVKQYVGSVQAGVEQVKNDVDTVKTKVDTLKNGVDRVQEVRIQVDAVRGQLDTVDGKVDALKAGVDQIEDVKSRVDEVKGGLIQEVRGQVVQVKGQVDALGTTITRVLAQMGMLTTSSEHRSLSDLVTNQIGSLKRDTLSALYGLAREDRLTTILEEVMAIQLQELTHNINKTREECGHAESVSRLLDLVTSNSHNLVTLGQQFNSTRHTLASSCSQACEDVKQTLTEQQQTRCDTTTALEGNVARMGSTLADVERKVDQVVVYTEPPPPPPIDNTQTQTSHGTRGEVTPCEDSKFVASKGTISFNVCNAAVRFAKCSSTPLLAYHCCRSCTISGQIPHQGPWRYFKYPRTVLHSLALRLLRSNAGQ